MKILNKKGILLFAAFGLASSALAYNPISTYHYLADPGAAADDEYFLRPADAFETVVAWEIYHCHEPDGLS